MIVLPVRSIVRTPAGTGTDAAGPTRVMRLSLIMITPSSMTPPFTSAIVTMRAPVSTSVPDGFAALTEMERSTPVSGGLYDGFSSSFVGAVGIIASTLAE